MDKARAALVRLETARDWAVDVLNKKGVDELLTVIGKLDNTVGENGELGRLDTLELAILGRTVKKTEFANVSKTDGVDSASGKPRRKVGETERRADRIVEEHAPGLIDIAENAARFAKLYNLTPKEGVAVLKLVKENATSIKSKIDARGEELENGATSERNGSAQVRPTDTRGQA